MDKKGVGWGTIVIIIIILVSFVIILGLYVYYGEYISEMASTSKSELLKAMKS